MRNPVWKVLLYWLAVAGIMLAFRAANHSWPPLALNIGIVTGGTCYIWSQSRKQNNKAP